MYAFNRGFIAWECVEVAVVRDVYEVYVRQLNSSNKVNYTYFLMTSPQPCRAALLVILRFSAVRRRKDDWSDWTPVSLQRPASPELGHFEKISDRDIAADLFFDCILCNAL